MSSFTELVLSYIIKLMVHKTEKLTQKEKKVQEKFLKSIKVEQINKNKKPIVIAMIGLIASGKTTVANLFSKKLSAVIIEADVIRILLRKEGEKFEGTRKIIENIAQTLVKKGCNIIIDSDHINSKKRASLRTKINEVGGKLFFVRTFADRDVIFGRIISASYKNKPDDFFGGAKTIWQGTEQNKGAVIKSREMWRRTPQHYTWVNQTGGKWILKKLNFKTFDIDTTDKNTIDNQINKIVLK